jgi:MscS family membrane protein
MRFCFFSNCYEFALAAFDGVYGSLTEVFSILLLVILTNFVAKSILSSLHQRFKKQDRVWKDSFVSALYKPLSWYVWFFALVHALDLIHFKIFAESSLSNMHLVLIIGATLSLAWFLMRWKYNVVQYMIVKSRKQEITLERGKVDVFDKILTMLIIFITVMLLLEITGQNMNTLIAFGGVGGLAIAFASQEIISCFFGGLMIYITHPFAVGDWINLPEKNLEGYVEEIGWYMTRLRTFEKRPIYIPNSTFSRIVVMTPSRMSHRRFKETFGLRYVDLPNVKNILADIKKMLNARADIDHSQTTLTNLSGFNTYSIDIIVSCYTIPTDTSGFYDVKEDILFAIADIVQKNNSELAYPTNVTFSKIQNN